MADSFARRQLEKHGWTEGAGLGSREQGISEAIRVKLKRDTAGVGHDPGKQFTFHWWNHVFNKAASGITVEEGEDGVVVKSKKKNKTEQREAAKKSLYSNFIKSSLLADGTEQTVEKEGGQQDSSDEEPDEKTQVFARPDELFKICGGRTVHKGARHGLKLNGKLARVQEQERLFLEKQSSSEPLPKQNPTTELQVNGDSSPSSIGQEDRSDMKTKKKKKSKKRKRENEENGEKVLDGESGNEMKEETSIKNGETVIKKKKKKKRKENSDDNDDMQKEESSFCETEGNTVSKSKKRSKKSRTEKSDTALEEHIVAYSEDSSKNCEDSILSENADISQDCVPDLHHKGHKKSKKKKKKKEKCID